LFSIPGLAGVDHFAEIPMKPHLMVQLLPLQLVLVLLALVLLVLLLVMLLVLSLVLLLMLFLVYPAFQLGQEQQTYRRRRRPFLIFCGFGTPYNSKWGIFVCGVTKRAYFCRTGRPLKQSVFC